MSEEMVLCGAMALAATDPPAEEICTTRRSGELCIASRNTFAQVE
jgi:hypothetical protein